MTETDAESSPCVRVPSTRNIGATDNKRQGLGGCHRGWGFGLFVFMHLELKLLAPKCLILPPIMPRNEHHCAVKVPCEDDQRKIVEREEELLDNDIIASRLRSVPPWE